MMGVNTTQKFIRYLKHIYKLDYDEIFNSKTFAVDVMNSLKKGDPKYLQKWSPIMPQFLSIMRDPESCWIVESFDNKLAAERKRWFGPVIATVDKKDAMKQFNDMKAMYKKNKQKKIVVLYRFSDNRDVLFNAYEYARTQKYRGVDKKMGLSSIDPEQWKTVFLTGVDARKAYIQHIQYAY